ncbi:RNA polymerase II elongation factor ELL3 [Porphyrio hochstetteri]
MPRPRAELRGRLRYRGCGPGPRLSLLHVRLSAAAARALRGCGRRQVGPGRGPGRGSGAQAGLTAPAVLAGGTGTRDRLPGQPGGEWRERGPPGGREVGGPGGTGDRGAVTAWGNPGRPGSGETARGALGGRYLTVPGGPGDPPRLFAFSLSRCSQDEPRGSFECARLAEPRLGSILLSITVRARESGGPALCEPVSPAREPGCGAAVEPDRDLPGYGKGITAPDTAGMSSLLRKGFACPDPESKDHGPATTSPRASAPSLLQPRRKREVPRRLGGKPVGRRGGAWLEEDTDPDPAACSRCVQGMLAGQTREGCAGDASRGRQQAALLQHRNQDCRPSAPTFLVPLQQPPEHGSPQATSRSLLGVKRLALLDFSDPRGSKRSRAPVSGYSSHKRQSRPQTLGTRLLGAHGQQQAGPLPPSSHAGELESPESEEEAGSDWEEGTPCPEQHLPVPGEAGSQAGSSSSAEIPDYMRRIFHTICSAEQRRAYEAAFSADYSEYRDLHSRIGDVRRKFIHLGARMRSLREGTEERKALEARIVQEYRHFKKTYPSYRQEKDRCEYLHQKLSHIKILILQFEGRGRP